MKNSLQRIYIFSLLLFCSGIVFSQNVDTIYVGTSNGVSASSNFFPSSITVNPGDTVLFLWFGGFHTMTPDNGTWVFPATNFTLSGAGQKQKVKVAASNGTYTYHCTVHGTGMNGTIQVGPVTAGTHAAKFSYGLNVSPNPFVDEVTLNIDPSHSELTSIRVTDLIGNEVATIDLSSKTSIYRMDLSHLKPGVYFCNLYSDKGILETRKLFRTK